MKYDNLNIKIKKLHTNAEIPKYAKPGDAGMDLVAVSEESLGNGKIKYGTGLAIEIPKGHVGLLFPRSSVFKTSFQLANSVGVIDSEYRGEISLIFKYTGGDGPVYEIGDRIGQLIILPYPKINFEEVEDLSKSERGQGGFGSTGN